MAEYSNTIPTKLGYYVYRLWNADGVCLYVGCCGERNPRRVSYRLCAHKTTKEWWPEVARIDVATFTCPAEVIAEERAQVSALRPLHNKYLQARCPNGHDLTRPFALYQNDQCAACRANNTRKRTLTGADLNPDRRRRNADLMRRAYKRRTTKPQATLW